MAWEFGIEELLVVHNAGNDAACQRCETGKARRNCKTAKELGKGLQFVSHVNKHTRFCFERTTMRASGK